MKNEHSIYEAPEIIEEGVLEIRAGSPVGFPEDPFELGDL
jgi:hypothetical protein